MTETTEYTEEDMAAVGRATMAAIKAHANIGWAPADCPSGIIGDLRNERDELAAEIEKLRTALSGLCVAVENGSSTRQPWNAAMAALKACGPNVVANRPIAAGWHLG